MRYSIAQMYSGMIHTAPNSVRDGEVGKAFQTFLDWEADSSRSSRSTCAARVARMLSTTVSVRTDGEDIEYARKTDLNLKSGTLHSLTQKSDIWRIEILWGDFSGCGVKVGTIEQLSLCFPS
jgi:hypothetical protein